MPAIVVQREQIDHLAINEIQKISVSKFYERYIHLLQKEPEKFPYFDNLKKVESNAYYLAKEYSDNLKKNLVSKNAELESIADRIIKDTTHYDFIQRLDQSALANEIFVNVLIDIVRDRVDSAYQLATYREKSRQEAHFEKIKHDLALILSSNARIEEKMDRILAHFDLNNNNEQIIAAAVALRPESQLRVPANPLPEPQQQSSSSPSNAALQTQNTAPTTIVKSSPETPKSGSRKRVRRTAPKSSPSPKQKRNESPVATRTRRLQTQNARAAN